MKEYRLKNVSKTTGKKEKKIPTNPRHLGNKGNRVNCAASTTTLFSLLHKLEINMNKYRDL